MNLIGMYRALLPGLVEVLEYGIAQEWAAATSRLSYCRTDIAMANPDLRDYQIHHMRESFAMCHEMSHLLLNARCAIPARKVVTRHPAAVD